MSAFIPSATTDYIFYNVNSSKLNHFEAIKFLSLCQQHFWVAGWQWKLLYYTQPLIKAYDDWTIKKISFQLGLESIIWINVPICMQRLFKPTLCVFVEPSPWACRCFIFFAIAFCMWMLANRKPDSEWASQPASRASMMQYSNYYMCRRIPNKPARGVLKRARVNGDY